MSVPSPTIDADAPVDVRSEEKVLIRKLDVHLLPVLSVLYLLSHLNSASIANAKLGGLERDVHLTSEQYRWCLSIFFLGYLFFQIPSNIVLRRWKPSSWISLIVLLWGLTAICMAAVRSFSDLLLARFLLGSFQCGFFPGVIYYISLWYRRKEQAIRLGCFWSFAALSGAFGGLIASAVMLIQSTTFAQWQLIFLVASIPPIFLAIVTWFYLPDSPEQARFLSEKQRQLQVRRLADDAGASLTHSFSWAQVTSVFTDWKTYVYALIYATGTVALQWITLFLPTLIQRMGDWTLVQTQLMTVPPYIAAFFTILAVARSSDRRVERSFHLVFTNLLALCGLALLILVDHQRPYILYIGVILATAGVYSNVSLKVAWVNNNFASLTRRAVAVALIISIGALGGVISGQIDHETEQPGYLSGQVIVFSFIVLQTIIVLGLRATFTSINRQRAQMNDEQINQVVEQYGGHELAGDRHPNFRYTL